MFGPQRNFAKLSEMRVVRASEAGAQRYLSWLSTTSSAKLKAFTGIWFSP